MKKIVIHYPFIAQYRMPIFRLLSNSIQYHYEFWADETSGDKFLVTDTVGLDFKKVQLKHPKIPIINKQLEWQPQAIKKILSESIDCYIILGNPNSLSNWLCVLIAKIRKIPILMWSHGYLKDEKGTKGFIRKFFYNLADGHLLYGNRAKRIMLAKGFKSEDLHVVYNSLDYETQKSFREKLTYQDRLSTRAQLSIDENAILLIAIGRVMTKLKLDLAIKAVKHEIDNGQNTALLIVGDGPQKVDLENLVKSLELSKYVIFYGACHAEEELSYLYNAADYSVVMGKVGLAAMHSLAYGIPMITNDNMDDHFPEIEAIIDEKTGWYFQENSITDFCSKLNPISYRDIHFHQCIDIIEKYYNPGVQKEFIETAISNYCGEK